MSSHIETKDDAIRWLIEQGFYAYKRDWNFGETVCAAANETVTSDIRAYQYVVCIHPHQGAWACTDLGNQLIEMNLCGGLHEATIKAAEMLRNLQNLNKGAQ